MLAFAPWTGLSWSTEFSRSWRESPTRTRICSCRYSTRSTRQTVSERGASFDRAMVKCLKCDCICARCRHNSNVGESRENSDVLFTNAFDKIPRHNQSTVEAIPDVPCRLLRGRRRKDADGVSGDRVGRLRGLATQQTTASARSFHRVPFMSTASRSFHCTPNDSSAALLLNLVVAEKVSQWSPPHRRDSEVQDEWWDFENSPIALITVAEKCIAVCNWIILNWRFFVLRRRKSWWTVRCLLQLPGGSRAERRDSDLREKRSGLSLAKGHHATNHSHRTGWVLNWVGVVNFAWFVALRGIRELLEIKFKPEAPKLATQHADGFDLSKNLKSNLHIDGFVDSLNRHRHGSVPKFLARARRNQMDQRCVQCAKSLAFLRVSREEPRFVQRGEACDARKRNFGQSLSGAVEGSQHTESKSIVPASTSPSIFFLCLSSV